MDAVDRWIRGVALIYYQDRYRKWQAAQAERPARQATTIK
jgi:hypothetical protein